ncbi:MAG: TrkA family potassium uptake protein [Actinomycetota bacterium]|jgi:trk system potassium uptake protein|nr:TrkA family potassium uptake protein [Actinomycetota bacterium]
MRIAIAGSGKVGRALAKDLLSNGHQVLMIDSDPECLDRKDLAGAETLLGDVCEISVLEQADLPNVNILVATTGDDKVNLVVSLLAKTEFGVDRIVARVNHPKNEWLFDETWGVDVAVSTPQILVSLVEEAVSIGDLVKLFTFKKSGIDLVEVTLDIDSPVIGQRVGSVSWPIDTAPVAILRDGSVLVPTKDDTMEVGDELLFVSKQEQETALMELLCAPGKRRPHNFVA